MIASLYLGFLVKDLSRTRWSDRYQAVRGVFTSYQEIINAFQKIPETDLEKVTRQTAEKLLHKLCSFSCYIILLFLKNLMVMISALYQANAHLESMIEVSNRAYSPDTLSAYFAF